MMNARNAARILGMASLISLTLTGCFTNVTTSMAPAVPVSAIGSGDPKSTAPAGTPQPTQTGRGFAETFLKLLSENKVPLDSVRTDFLAQIAPPYLEDEKKRGYVQEKVLEWFAKQGKDVEFNILSELGLKDSPSLWYRGLVNKATKTEFFTLWISKAGDGVYQVRWFHRSPVEVGMPEGKAIPLEQMQPILVAQSFLEVVLGGTDPKLAPLLMTPRLLLSIGGEPSSADKARGIAFDTNFLQTKLSGYKGFTGYNVQNVKVEAKTATLDGELIDGTRKQKFTLTVTLDESGTRWQIDGFTSN